MPIERPKAVLVAVKFPSVDQIEFESSLAELERLVTTLGYEVVAQVTQARTNLAPSAVIGEGKLEELAALCGGSGETSRVPHKTNKARSKWERAEQEAVEDEDGAEADDAAREPNIQLVAVDHDISPSQLRNLERAVGTNVLDRTGVIIEIFHRHAKSREARLEVEIARLNYQAPRLRESPRGKERQQGRGAGEAALELDRRRIRDRIADLKEQLKNVEREQAVRRSHRKEARRVALVGYTNAGKSSLMRALTHSSVYVEDKLFATLDTTVRALQPEVRPRILVSDTVGFIKKLPHDLVASFKSTLDEAAEASLLLHVVDASDPDWENQKIVTEDVLSEVGAGGVTRKLVFNKIDRVLPADLEALQTEFPEAWFVSARRAEDVARVRTNIIDFFEARYVEADFKVPYAKQRFVSEMHELGRVLEERYEDEAVFVRVRSDSESIESIRSRLV
jgi:GTP-binding protein HflX